MYIYGCECTHGRDGSAVHTYKYTKRFSISHFPCLEQRGDPCLLVVDDKGVGRRVLPHTLPLCGAYKCSCGRQIYRANQSHHNPFPSPQRAITQTCTQKPRTTP